MRPIFKRPILRLPIKDDIVPAGDGRTTFIGDGGGGCIDSWGGLTASSEGGRD